MKEIEVIKKIEQKELVLIEFREERVRETH